VSSYLITTTQMSCMGLMLVQVVCSRTYLQFLWARFNAHWYWTRVCETGVLAIIAPLVRYEMGTAKSCTAARPVLAKLAPLIVQSKNLS
jgi:hypothetical protein